MKINRVGGCNYHQKKKTHLPLPTPLHPRAAPTLFPLLHPRHSGSGLFIYRSIISAMACNQRGNNPEESRKSEWRTEKGRRKREIKRRTESRRCVKDRKRVGEVKEKKSSITERKKKKYKVRWKEEQSNDTSRKVGKIFPFSDNRSAMTHYILYGSHIDTE